MKIEITYEDTVTSVNDPSVLTVDDATALFARALRGAGYVPTELEAFLYEG
jgi:hypothetical protein